VAAAEPPSLWHPLEPAQEKAPSRAVTITANGSLSNGHGERQLNGSAKAAAGGRTSVPGVYLDLETELVHAQVRLQSDFRRLFKR